MNIESVLIDYLKTALKDVPVAADIPAARPARFVTIERTGGRGDRFLDRPQVTVQCWESSRLAAADLALQVRAALIDVIVLDSVTSIDVSGPYNWPDPKSGQARYQMVANLVTYN